MSVFDGPFNPEFSLGAPPREHTDVVFERSSRGRPRIFIEKDRPDQDGSIRMHLSQDFVYHSPDGFEWGYGGSGPSDLALNLLCEFVDPPTAFTLHNPFKFEFIAPLDQEEGGRIPTSDIYEWLEEQFEERAA